jgi:hypothetical protein
LRVHGIHLQGIRTPPGEHRLAFDPGYNAVIADSAANAQALVRLFEALLYPSDDPAALIGWKLPGDPKPARAGLSFSFGVDAFRVIADIEDGRMLLGRYDAGRKTYERVSTEPREIAAALAEAGLPSRDHFRALHLCDGPARASGPPTPVPTPATLPDPEPPRVVVKAAEPEVDQQRAELELRLDELRAARDRFVDLEREEKHVAAELEQRAPLSQALDDLDARVERFRDHSDTRAQERAGVEAGRRALLDERARQKSIPAAQMSSMWLGVALGASGALAGTLVQPLFYLVSAVGAGTALFGLIIARNARRRLGRVEARLAALRVREASIERRFESETAPMRSLLGALKLDDIDELAREAADYRGLVGRADGLKRELEEARRGLPESELAELESRLRELESKPAPEPEPEPALVSDEADTPTESDLVDTPPTPTLEIPDAEQLEALFAAVGSESGKPEADVRALLGPVLPLYLRALTGAVYTRAWFQPGDGWFFRREGQRDRVPFQEAPETDRIRLALAFRIGLLEALAATVRLPLVCGPAVLEAGGEPSAEEDATFARALKRLSSLVQVIHCTADSAPWSEYASRVLEL